jgi:hypothetical protein
MGVFGWMIGVTFSLAHWILAQRYWILSFKIPSILQISQPKSLKCIKITNLIVITNIVFWPTLGMIIFFLMHFHSGYSKVIKIFGYIFFDLSLLAQIILDTIACVVLYDAFRRIRAITSKADNLHVNSLIIKVH